MLHKNDHRNGNFNPNYQVFCMLKYSLMDNIILSLYRINNIIFIQNNKIYISDYNFGLWFSKFIRKSLLRQESI